MYMGLIKTPQLLHLPRKYSQDSKGMLLNQRIVFLHDRQWDWG